MGLIFRRIAVVLLPALLASGLLGCASANQAFTAPGLKEAVAASEQLYTNPVYLWSIRYPADWTIDSKDPSFVRIRSAGVFGLCGIHSASVPFKTVDEFIDLALAHNERLFREKGLRLVVLTRRRISLPNDVIGSDVETEILFGGKSRRIYVLAEGRGFVVDCETYATNWGKLEASFDRIISSFTLGK